ncbi:OadG family protein [Thermococcus sp.]|uniref:OadG family protein n=1 Tax=Thermococcus sp. TaxID=35749 RepID=UPI00262D887C|nr:OadG family protein [Thermococcus sp.]
MDVAQLIEGGWITVIGVTVVFTILGILALVLYFVGWLERRLVGMESKAAPVPAPGPAVKAEKAEEEKPPALPPRELAVITSAVLAYLAKKAEQLRPLPFRRKVSDAWRLYGLEAQMEETEHFNYEMGKW